MTVTPWDEFRYGPWAADLVVPTEPPSEQTRAAKDLPRTLRPVSGAGVLQRPVFDPAMKQHGNGMRLSEPHFADPERGAAWFAARAQAIDHVLAAVATSQWAPHLMVRGSVLLSAWFGPEARLPGDVDFIVLPQTWGAEDDRTTQMFGDLAHRAEQTSRTSGSTVHIAAADAIDSEIWTYDRVPGRRTVLPWTSTTPGIPAGTIQLDFVFNESVPQDPTWSDVPRLANPGPPARLLTATPELSLAWKLLWLTEDMHPEGKDFYDAVLLAENCVLPYELLAAVLNHDPKGAWLPGLLADLDDSADWPEFAKDYPHLEHAQEQFIERLQTALAPLREAAPGGTTQ